MYRGSIGLRPPGSITSCLAWFAVDLFINDRSRVVAVTLDLWEP